MHDNFIVGEGENMGMHEGTVYIAYAICMQALNFSFRLNA